jgi:4-amino-4-deoxy-L-arabinose transferase-like glycosyltransferase
MLKAIRGRIDIFIVGILLLSVILNFYDLQDAGSNSYYTVAVKSMMTSFENFFFASFDPEGFITVDKPPVALWIQTISALIFGLSDFSVLLPEALAGVISVWMLYIIVKPKFGPIAARLASLVLACSPIFVAVVRTNNVDSILILTLLVATWALMKSVEKKKINFLLLSFALIGVGFNIKMLQAYMVLPAFYLFYFIARELKWTKKVIHLALATLILAGVSLSWPLAVQFTPEENRPYMGGSDTNSALELAFGYNGIARLTGEQNGTDGGQTQGDNPPTGTNDQQSEMNGSESNETTADQNGMFDGGQPPSFDSNQAGGMMRGDMGGGMFGTGEAGPLRLFSTELSGQISFLFPFVLFGVIGLLAGFLHKRKMTIQHKFALFWIVWLVPMMVFFSIAQFFHQYYLSMLGPAIGALVGIGFTVLWQQYNEEKSWRSWLFPIAILATCLFEALIIYQNKDTVSLVWMYAAIVVAILIFGLCLLMKQKEIMKTSFAIVSILSLLIIPLYWTVISINKDNNESTPIAGPSTQGNGRGMGMGIVDGGRGPNGSGNIQEGDMLSMDGSSLDEDNQSDGRQPPMNQGMLGSSFDSNLVAYLEENNDGEKYFVAVPSAQDAYSIMLNTEYAVMAMGGFSGTDPALTVEKLEEMTENGEVKYFLLSGNGGRQSETINSWILENCEEVPSSEWSSNTSEETSNQSSFGGAQTLYVYNGDK